MAQFASAPAFPGAEGYARYVTGGRGGKVLHVTNLNDSGAGSLRAAIETSGNRIIVFDVCGTIALRSRLTIKNGNVSILGQTAPGDGICLANYPLYINASNVIMRYIRCRMGDVDIVEDDAMSSYIHGTADEKTSRQNIIIDHCSMSWSTDECGSFYGNKFFTLQWCYLTESLRISIHGKGKHGYGGIWGGKNVSFHHNLLAHHDSRNARLDHDFVNEMKGVLDYVNNCVYNWGGNNCYGGESVKGTGYRMVNMIGNYYKPGPATTSRKTQLANATSYCTNCCKEDGNNVEPAHFYLKDNYIEGASATNADNWKGIVPDDKNKIDVLTLKSDVPFTIDDEKYAYNTISIQPAATAWDKVLAYGGCSYHRDLIDTRIANEAKTGTYTYNGSQGSTGGLIDSQSDVGGWCALNTYGKFADTDGDGMPDAWEEANGLDPNKANSTGYDLDPKQYYTNIEVYANSLVEEQIRAQRDDAESTFDEYYPTCKMIKEVIKEEVIASGDIVWPLASADGIDELTDVSPVVSSSLSEYIDLAEAWQGANFTITGTFTDADKVTGVSLTATAVCDASDKSSVQFKVTPQSEYYFRPTSVDFYAVKNGTNTATTLTANLSNDAGNMTVATNVDLPRANSSTDGNKSAYHCNVQVENPVSSNSTTTLSLKVNNLPASKQFGISTVVMNGDIVKKVTSIIIYDPSAINHVINDIRPSSAYYNLSGQRVAPGTKGILIHNGRKILVK